LLVPRARPEALAAALRSLLADEATVRRIGAAGRQRILSAYTLDDMIRRTVAVYERAAGDR
jgi:glycosyltransferase involved in cell wall biosynthesis